MATGEVQAPRLSTAVSTKWGRGSWRNIRTRPISTAMMPGLVMTFLKAFLGSAWVNREMPALHMRMRVGMMNREPRKSPWSP